MQKLNWLGLPFLGDEGRPCHQSDLNNFRRCPRQHAFKRVREARELPPEYLALITVKGKVYHQMMARIQVGRLPIHPDALTRLFRRTFLCSIYPQVLDEKKANWLDNQSAKAGEVLANYQAEHPILGDERDPKLLACEQKFNFRWGPFYQRKYWFAGRVDAVFEGESCLPNHGPQRQLVDYKSGDRFPACVSWDQQLGVYGMACELGAVPGVPAGPLHSRGITRLMDYARYMKPGKYGGAGDYMGPQWYPADPSVTPAMVMEHEVYPLLLEIREREKTGRFQGGSRDRNDCSWCGQRAACEAMMDIQKPEEAFLGELRRELG